MCRINMYKAKNVTSDVFKPCLAKVDMKVDMQVDMQVDMKVDMKVVMKA